MSKKNDKSKKTTKRQSRAGWGFPEGEKHAHFFIGGASLCGELEAYVGPLDKDMKPTPDDCPHCRKLIEAVLKVAKAA
jgi:hypothetical protein